MRKRKRRELEEREDEVKGEKETRKVETTDEKPPGLEDVENEPVRRKKRRSRTGWRASRRRKKRKGEERERKRARALEAARTEKSA